LVGSRFENRIIDHSKLLGQGNMAVEKSLTIREYLEPRAAAGARSKGARRLASFQEMLKKAQLKPADSLAAGKRITDYVRSPVLMAHAQRQGWPSATIPDVADRLQPSAGGRNSTLGGRYRSGEFAPAVGSSRDLRSGRYSAGGSPKFGPYSSTNEQMEKSIRQAAAKYSLSPELIRSVIRAESNFQVDAVSPAGARGLMQLMPETAKELGVANVFDVQQNIDGGARYLRQMLDRFGGDLKRALAAYNAGPGAVEQFNGDVPYPETRQYVKRVLRSAGLG
jgi:hypothetical protein